MNESEECVICNWVMAGVGLVIAGVFLYISLDVIRALRAERDNADE